MTPEEAKKAAGENVQKIQINHLSHFAQLVHQTKETYEGYYEIPFAEEWFSLPTNEYNPGLAVASMGVSLSGYENEPSNNYKYIRGSFEGLGCEDIDITSYYHLNDENYIAALDDVNLISYAMGHRKIMAERDGVKKERDLFIFYGRGTSVSVEWNSNSDVANSVADGNFDIVYHEGFKKTADSAYKDIVRYIEKHNIDTKEGLVWIVAHSRGAAITNILAAMLNEDTELGFTKDRIYSYNFAASPGTRRKDAQGPKFDNIMNVQSVEDYIPRIPPVEWDFVRFGKDFYFPSICTRYEDYMKYRDKFMKIFKEWTRVDFPAFHGNEYTNWFERHIEDISPNAEDMYCKQRYTAKGTLSFAQYFRFITDIGGQQTKKGLINDAKLLGEYGTGVYERFLKYLLFNQVIGHNASGAHQEEGYLIKMMLLYEMDIDIEQCDVCDTRRFTVYGPVDLVVKDADGITVARIEKGEVDEKLYETEGYIAMFYDKDTDANQVWVPNDKGYQIELTARENGNFDCTWTTLEPMGEVIEQDFYEGIDLRKGKTVTWDDICPSEPTEHVTEGNNLNCEVYASGTDDLLKEDEAYNYWDPTGYSVVGFVKTRVIADALAARMRTYGDHVAVHAYHDTHQHFIGWFENDELVCADKSYCFTIKGDRELEARFRGR